LSISLKKATMIVLEHKAPSSKRVLASYSDKLNFRKFFLQRRGFLIGKRIIDITFSSLMVVFILSWLIPIIALLIRLTSKGPVFFIQKRVGFLGKSFNCIKFRTMVVNEEANTKQAVDNDPRITKLGRFLRLSNIDELPQFFNVLMGEMSIVGPRPHMHRDCNDFSKVIANYKFRSIAKPGITGLAQVKGYRGPVKDEECMFRRYQWDSFYVRNQDYKLDTRIIGLTISCTLRTIFSLIFSSKKSTQENIQEPVVSYQLNAGKYLN
jgi:putative colanic acid biosynthesis UDP-glucose lipid carrier transferase